MYSGKSTALSLANCLQEFRRDPVALSVRSFFGVRAVLAVLHEFHFGAWQLLTDTLHFAGLGPRIKTSVQE